MLGHQNPIVLAVFTLATVNFALADIPPILGEEKKDTLSYRLPNNTKPLEYNLHLKTNVHTQTDTSFTGIVEIKLISVVDTKFITLHQHALKIETVSLSSQKEPDTPIEIKEPEYNTANDFMTVNLKADDGTLKENEEYILKIAFSGSLNLKHFGFYLSTYKNVTGSKRSLATTQFEPAHAREAFPCFDEPALRAKFKLDITHGPDYHALSNMPSMNVEVGEDGLKTTYFPMTTVKMPLYLVCFIVSDFSFKNLENKNGFKHRAFARPTAIHEVDFALETAVKVLDALEKDFGPFQLPKLDQVAIPDFNAGAMENWGLITYKENYFFYDSEDSMQQKENVAMVVAHELSHQWFGNQVTPKWWTYLWLNEGFANLLQHYYTGLLFPEWNYLDKLLASIQRTMDFDSKTSFVRPMTYYVETTSQIQNYFDRIAYSKSGAVLHMFWNAFSNKSFYKGLNIYLMKMNGLAAVEDDLFEALEAAVKSDQTLPKNLSVATIFSSWSRQSGFPLVTVNRNYATGEVELVQQRYYDDDDFKQSPSLWWIPYSWVTASTIYSQSEIYWFSVRKEIIAEVKKDDSEWFLLNRQQSGYYRVQYDLKNYALLARALDKNHNDFHKSVRSQLLSDAFSFAETRRIRYDVVLDLMKYLRKEAQYISWMPVFRGIHKINQMFAGNENYNLFTKYMQELLVSYYRLTKNEVVEGPMQSEARKMAIQWSCLFGVPACLKDTNYDINLWLRQNITFHREFEGILLSNGMRSADKRLFEEMVARLNVEKQITKRVNLIRYLAHTGSRPMLETYLNHTISKDSKLLKTSWERHEAFVSIVRASQLGVELGVTFLRKNFEKVIEHYEITRATNCLLRLASYVTSKNSKNEFLDLLSHASLIVGLPNFHNILEAHDILSENEKWKVLHSYDIQQWLQKNVRRIKPAQSDSNRVKSLSWVIIPLMFACIFHSTL